MYDQAAIVIHELEQLPATLGACHALGVPAAATSVSWLLQTTSAPGTDPEQAASAVCQALAASGHDAVAAQVLPESEHAQLSDQLRESAVQLLVMPAGPASTAFGMLGGEMLAAHVPVCVAREPLPATVRGVGVVHGEQMTNAIRCMEHLGPRLSASQRCHLLGVDALPGPVRQQLASLMGLQRAPYTAVLSDGPALRAYATAWDVDVLAWSVSPAGGVLRLSALRAEMALGATPTPLGLLIPHREARSATAQLEVTDAVWLDGRFRSAAQCRDGLGFVQPVDPMELTLIEAGRALERVQVLRGQFEFAAPTARDADAQVLVGATRDENRVETLFGLHRPGKQVITLCDAAADPEKPELSHGGGASLWPVRLDANRSIDELRKRWAPLGAGLIDAASVLEDGHPSDLPGWSRALRLHRVASHLRLHGYAVHRVVAAAPPASAVRLPAFDAPAVRDLPTRLSWLADARDCRVHDARLLLDNQKARHALIALFDAAAEQILVQSYLVDEDPSSAELLDALIRAGARGVRVCLLVDSLLGRHHSLGMTHTLLARCEAAPGVQLRVVRPTPTVPSLQDLKWRSHRKLVVVDARDAVVTGRNFGQAYYRGFDEVQLRADSPWSEVPWLDASLHVRGSVVPALMGLFDSQWTESGGAPIAIAQPEAAPDVAAPGAPAQLLQHTGMRDANMVEAYRALFDTAGLEIVLANTFPIQLELLGSLLRALARGVQVRVIVGHVRPLHGEGVPFVGAMPRELASQVVFGRLDTLVRHGAQVHACRAYSEQCRVNPVLPNLHAKLVTVDGRVTAIGSANLDITAGYWEDELMLVVHDPALTTRVNAALADWWRDSPAMDPDTLKANELTQRRAWLSRLWPSVIG